MSPRAQSLYILGGGQLAMMLAEAGHRLGTKVVLVCSESDEPARLAEARGWATRVEEFPGVLPEGARVTVESEWAIGTGQSLPESTLFPKFLVLEALRSKLAQKKLLTELGIPTARWTEVSSAEDVTSFLERERIADAVLKQASYGYDGKGNLVWSQASGAERTEFFARALRAGTEVYAEERVSFGYELASLAVRDRGGELRFYPVVESVQERGMCRWVEGPSSASPSLLEMIFRTHGSIMHRLGYVGVLAIEWFHTRSGEVVVNELAPRVHNTGHWTRGFAETDQFENHLRAGLGLPLGDTSARSPRFGMWNLLGEYGAEVGSEQWAAWHERVEACSGVRPVSYGKSGGKRRRKLAHVSIGSRTTRELVRMKTHLENLEKGILWQRKP